MAQNAKHAGSPCGDVVACHREPSATTVICADGIGSGMRAHIAAQMCASRLLESVRQGFSLRRAFTSLVRSMEQSRDPTRPWTAFSVARIRNDGMTTVLAYEAPGPVLVTRHHATGLPAHPLQLGGALVSESHCHLEPGEGLLLVSDGVTQAGLGRGLPRGWQTEGLVSFISDSLNQGIAVRQVAANVLRQARLLWRQLGDDCTAALAYTKPGLIVNVLTGPPVEPERDAEVVERFLAAEGLKIVCGGTTAEIVARVLGQPLSVEQNASSLVAPPRYELEGIDLVTEGAVTLTQVYHLLDEDTRDLKEDSGVRDLCLLLNVADRVNIVLGKAHNRATQDVSFRQRGVLTRRQIVPLLARKLETMGKLVVVTEQ